MFNPRPPKRLHLTVRGSWKPPDTLLYWAHALGIRGKVCCKVLGSCSISKYHPNQHPPTSLEDTQNADHKPLKRGTYIRGSARGTPYVYIQMQVQIYYHDTEFTLTRLCYSRCLGKASCQSMQTPLSLRARPRLGQ